MKRFLSSVLVITLFLSCAVFNASAVTSSVNVRIEGADNNIFSGVVELELTDKSTVADVLAYLDEVSRDITITGIEDGYITEINGEKAGAFGGWDGWYYAVNGAVPDVGMSSCTVCQGDNIVIYYGDYPCQYPRIDIDRFYKGILKFESYDTVYDDDWNPTSSWTPITDALVTVGDSVYTTDENGVIYADTSKLFGSTTVQIEKKSPSGAPAVCRFEEDYSFVYHDINIDGKINIKDGASLQKHFACITALSEKSLSVADVDGDGDITITDVTALQKMIAEVSF